jgi:predicted GNAT family acetyltransferase
MRVVRYPDPQAFWRDTRHFLERDEVGNTQLLAIGARHAQEAIPEAPAGFAVLADDDEPVGAALLNNKGTLFLSPQEETALAALHAAIAAEPVAVTDVVAESQTARAWVARMGVGFGTHVALRFYRLETVAPVPPTAGALRACGEADFELLTRWQQAFIDEIGARNITDTAADLVRRRLDGNGAWLWEVDGVPVAHAGHRPTPVCSARIAPVYTLPEHRGRGYAAALVAATCSALLAQGRFPLYLFADMANPVANGVYRRVGFEAVGEHLHLMRSDA